MALAAVISKLEDVAETFRGEYKPAKVGDKDVFVLDVTASEGYELDNVAALKTSLGRERTNKTNLETQLARFKDLPADLDIHQALAELEELKTIDPKKEADKLANAKVEAAKQQLVTAHAKELKTRDERNNFLTAQVEELLIDREATAAIAELKGSPDLLLPHVRKQTRVKEENGKFSVEVIDKDGNVKIGDSSGRVATIKDLIAEMRQSDTFGRAFEGDGTTGSGKRPGTEGSGKQSLKRSTMTAQQKADYQTKHGQAEFLKLPK